MAAQLIVTNLCSRRRLRWWMARANSSLPVPVSPRTRTVASVGATISTCWSASRSGGLSPTIPSNGCLAGISPARHARSSLTSSLRCAVSWNACPLASAIATWRATSSERSDAALSLFNVALNICSVFAMVDPQPRANRINEGFLRERFTKERERSGGERLPPRDRIIVRADEDHREPAVRGQELPLKIHAAHPAQSEVDNQAPDAVEPRRPEEILGRAEHLDLEPERTQQAPDRQADGFVVVDDSDDPLIYRRRVHIGYDRSTGRSRLPAGSWCYPTTPSGQPSAAPPQRAVGRDPDPLIVVDDDHDPPCDRRPCCAYPTSRGAPAPIPWDYPATTLWVGSPADLPSAPGRPPRSRPSSASPARDGS